MKEQELTAAFSALQNRVEKVAAQQIDLNNQLNQSKMRSMQGRTRWSPIGDLMMASLSVIVIGNFAADNIQGLVAAPIAALPAVILFAFAVFLINLSVRQLILSMDLDYAKPIVETQVQLAKLRKLRLQATQWTFIFALPIWVLFPILLGQMLISPKFIFALNPGWVVGNIVFGVAMAPVVDWIMRKSRFARSLQDTFAGKDIVEAENFLGDLQEFQVG